MAKHKVVNKRITMALPPYVISDINAYNASAIQKSWKAACGRPMNVVLTSLEPKLLLIFDFLLSAYEVISINWYSNT